MYLVWIKVILKIIRSGFFLKDHNWSDDCLLSAT